MKPALFYEKIPGSSVVQCGLCPHNCRIQNGNAGLCGARRNRGGVLFAESYGQVTSLALDPIEKKPLNRFHPGSRILSVGSYGCNMKCPYCQNYEISQAKPATEYFSPDKLLTIAKNTPDNIGIAFTYNEPLIGIEYILDCAPLFKKAGLKVVLVTNGLINPAPLKALLPFIDALNIDVKAFSESAYRKLGGDFSTVKQTVETAVGLRSDLHVGDSCEGNGIGARRARCPHRAEEMCEPRQRRDEDIAPYVCSLDSPVHVEITALIVPGQNDNDSDMQSLTQWLASLSPDIPLHISRYFPRYKSSRSPTPVDTMRRLAVIARERLKYVYLGNV
ncbi:MAG: radical SAM protein [Firmicutes bacterium]|nr:radical SAM protein [Bacillota bacterium]